MTSSYLFAYYAFDSQVSLSSGMSIKTGLFFFLTFCCIITPISGNTNHYCVMGNLKKFLRKIYPNNHKNYKNSKSRIQFYRLLQKKECTVIFITISAWCQSS